MSTLGSDPFTEMLIINYRNVTPATGVENIDTGGAPCVRLDVSEAKQFLW